jgi:RHS repeat-associated protein
LLDNNDGAQTKYLNGLGIDNKLRMQSGETVNYFLADHLGSTVGLTDITGNLTSQANYDSFGNQTGNLGSRYGFTGRERDDATALMYYRARWYDPKIGRFISEDPIGLAGGINQFSYVGNNPVNATDPFGLYEKDVHFLLTYYLAQKTGCFSNHEARLVAAANQGTDEVPATSPGLGETFKNAKYHALSDNASAGSGSQGLWNEALIGPTNYVGLGRYLHDFQDRFSHATFTNSFIGHAFGTHVVDKTSKDVAKTITMAMLTFNELNEYAQEKKCRCQGQWDLNMSVTVESFARVKTNHPSFSTIDAQALNPDTLSWDFLPFLLGGDRSAYEIKAKILGVPSN